MTDNHTPLEGSPFAWVAPGVVLTRFNEVATRVHHASADESPPEWFDPSHKPYHGGWLKDGFAVYWAVKLDRTARDTVHPFENVVVANAEHITQLSLLD